MSAEQERQKEGPDPALLARLGAALFAKCLQFLTCGLFRHCEARVSISDSLPIKPVCILVCSSPLVPTC